MEVWCMRMCMHVLILSIDDAQIQESTFWRGGCFHAVPETFLAQNRSWIPLTASMLGEWPAVVIYYSAHVMVTSFEGWGQCWKQPMGSRKDKKRQRAFDCNEQFITWYCMAGGANLHINNHQLNSNISQLSSVLNYYSSQKKRRHKSQPVSPTISGNSKSYCIHTVQKPIHQLSPKVFLNARLVQTKFEGW